MIGKGVKSLILQPVGRFLRFLSGQAVDNAGITLVAVLKKAKQLIAGIVFGGDGVTDIRAIEFGQELTCVAQIKPGDNLLLRPRVGRRREGYSWH